MHYKIEVLIKSTNPISCEIVEDWKPVRPVNGAPYEFKSESEADKILNICYPKNDRARVVKYEN
jgi:hypothetical protein